MLKQRQFGRIQLDRPVRSDVGVRLVPDVIDGQVGQIEDEQKQNEAGKEPSQPEDSVHRVMFEYAKVSKRILVRIRSIKTFHNF